jgi:hypothetical protein
MKWPLPILMLACLCPSMVAQQCPATSKLEMVKGEYLWQPGVTFTLQNFLANLVPKGNTSPQCFIKSTEIQHGRVYVSTQSLSKLFQEKMEQGQQQSGNKSDNGSDKKDDKKAADKDKKDDSKSSGGQQNIRDIAIKTKDNQLEISGKVKKGIEIPFDLIGPVDVANGHMLRFHIDKIKAAHIEAKGLLDALGVHLTKMLHPDAAKGVTVQDNAILFDTEQIANIKGTISHVALAGENLVIDFVTGNQRKTPGQGAKSAARRVASSIPVKK